jgi:hypothetical protein
MRQLPLSISFFFLIFLSKSLTSCKAHRGRDPIVVGFISTYAIGVYHHLRSEFESHSGEVYSIEHYVIKFVSDLLRALLQVDGFLRVI